MIKNCKIYLKILLIVTSFYLCSQASYVIHPLYANLTKTVFNDIAILTLATPLTFNMYVSAISLPASSAIFAGGLSCTASGWGYTVAGNGPRFLSLYLKLKYNSKVKIYFYCLINRKRQYIWIKFFVNNIDVCVYKHSGSNSM